VDFNDTPEETVYRSKACAWLDANAPRELGSMAAIKAWQTRKAEAGYACITWPREWGGAGGTPMESLIFNQEQERCGLTDSVFNIGLGMCLPTIMAFSDEQTKQRFVGPAMRGEEIWCQLFSEPASGSDVAASRTKAVRADDGSGDWILDGQKIWTSGAHNSDFGIVLVRTDPNVPKHRGLTMFWVDMKSPGIEVRAIHQASGGSEFNEVYFDGVRVCDDQRVGDVGAGWKVALVTLMNERLAVGGGTGSTWEDLLDLASSLAGESGLGTALDDGGFREKLADFYVKAEGLKLTRFRMLTSLSRGQTPGPEAAIGKIVSARQMQEVASEALERLDQYGLVSDPSDSRLGALQHTWFWGAAMRIAGGTDEILKNIIAERVLGLPLDIRVDRDVAFRDSPSGI
jgi:alkylation response protein AidB-like acyl-CoA dehydrogenase